MNVDHAEQLALYATRRGLWHGTNVLHWNKDGGYDFFPRKEYLIEMIATKEELSNFADRMIDLLLDGRIAEQNPLSYFKALKVYGADLSWHCSDFKIISVDADGRLRCCGYRRGKYCPEMFISDLPDKLDEYKERWEADMQNCPGCFWSYWWMAENAYENDEEMNKEMFKNHASKYFKFRT
jgi:hypothetical protein